MYWELFWQQDDKNASQTKRKKLLDGLAVRRCDGMQPAAMGSMAGPNSKGRKGSEKARRIWPVSPLLLLAGKKQGNDQSTSGDGVAQITRNGGADSRRLHRG